MKLKRLLNLNRTGFDHIEMLVTVAVVVVAGAVGSCISQNHESYADSLTGTVSCNITGLPKTTTVGQTVSGNLVIHNSNNVAVRSKLEVTLGEYKASGQSKGGGYRNFVEVPAGGSSTQTVGSMVVGKGYSKVIATGQGFNNPYQFSCKKAVDIK